MAKQDKTAGPPPAAEGAPASEAQREDTATIEQWREVRQPEPWAHEAAKTLRGWPFGKVVALSDYDAAIEAAHQIEVG